MPATGILDKIARFWGTLFARRDRARLHASCSTAVFVRDGVEMFAEVVDLVRWHHQAVRLRRWPSKELVDELLLPPDDTGNVIVEIAPSKSGMWLATKRHSGVSECGYDILSTGPLSRTAGRVEVNMVMTLPQFAEDDSLVAGALFHDEGSWWNNPDVDPGEPARGGLVRLGYLLVHRLPDHVVSRHALHGVVPAGWRPADPTAALSEGIPLSIKPTGDAIHLSLAQGAPTVVRAPFPLSIDLPFSPALDGYRGTT